MSKPIDRWASVSVLFAFAVWVHACAKSGSPNDDPHPVEAVTEAIRVSAPPTTLHRGVGEIIAGEVALRWAARHIERHPDDLRSVYFGRDALESLLHRPGAEGVSIQLAINDAGESTFVLVPLDREGARLPDDMSIAAMTNDAAGFFALDEGLICPPTCPKDESAAAALHRGVGSPISGASALRWTQAHQHRHPDGLRSVFFGRDALEGLLDRSGCEGLSIQRALDDAGTERLVLFSLDAEGDYLPGEDALDGASRDGEAAPSGVDNGIVCPPVCAKD